MVSVTDSTMRFIDWFTIALVALLLVLAGWGCSSSQADSGKHCYSLTSASGKELEVERPITAEVGIGGELIVKTRDGREILCQGCLVIQWDCEVKP
jgi:hypothetical protein